MPEVSFARAKGGGQDASIASQVLAVLDAST